MGTLVDQAGSSPTIPSPAPLPDWSPCYHMSLSSCGLTSTPVWGPGGPQAATCLLAPGPPVRVCTHVGTRASAHGWGLCPPAAHTAGSLPSCPQAQPAPQGSAGQLPGHPRWGSAPSRPANPPIKAQKAGTGVKLAPRGAGCPRKGTLTFCKPSKASSFLLPLPSPLWGQGAPSLTSLGH